MNAALANLPETQRRVLELAYLDGMTQTEIAERLGGAFRYSQRPGCALAFSAFGRSLVLR